MLHIGGRRHLNSVGRHIRPVSDHLTEYSRLPLTACCRSPAALQRIECNAKRGATKKIVHRLCKMNSPIRHLMLRNVLSAAATLAAPHVCIAPTASWPDRQAESNVRCGITIMLLSRDGSVGFCYGYDCVLPQTKIKSARGFAHFGKAK